MDLYVNAVTWSGILKASESMICEHTLSFSIREMQNNKINSVTNYKSISNK